MTDTDAQVSLYYGVKVAPGAKQTVPDSRKLPDVRQDLRLTPTAQIALKTFISKATITALQAGTFTIANAIPQGANDSQRVGRRLRMKSLRYKGGFVENTGVAAAEAGRIRFLWVLDRASQGAGAPVLTDVLQEAGAGVLRSWAFENLNNTSRFWIIQDRKWMGNSWLLSAGAVVANYPQDPIGTSGIFNGEIDLLGTEVIYNSGTTGVAADINTGALWLLVAGEDLVDGAHKVNVTFELKYYD